MTKIGLIQFILLLLISAAYGQKVKYKDIYALLSTKQFEQAEPFLKIYLRDNKDNPNAYLFMGNIFQEKASRNDVLKQTPTTLANMDTAILYYNNAYKALDDREVRRNKDYYEAYNRRDLRTGEFGVKLSDIQFDLEKRIENLKERIENVKMIKYYFSLADTTYQRTNALFVSLQKDYPSENQLYLRADANTIKNLVTLQVRFDSCVKAFENYKASISTVGKIGYNQKLTLAEIADFTKDGREAVDLYQDDLKLWDYKKFGAKSQAVIEKEILPMRHHLVAYDMELNKLREKLNTDSVSVRNDLLKLVDELLYGQLKKFDAEPLPMLVFALKTTDLEYRSALLEHKALHDSSDIHLQVRMLQAELKLLAKLDSTAAKLPEARIEQQATDYADFIKNAYNNPGVLQSFVRSLRDFGLREQRVKAGLLDQYIKSLKFIVDGSDSIPLSTTEAVSFYKPLVVSPEKFTLGLSLRDTTQVQGYFYTVNAGRTLEVKAYFPLDKSVYKPANVSAAKGLAFSDPAGQIFYMMVYSEKPVKEKFPATLAKIYRSDGLAWKMDYPLAFLPAELMLNPDTGELVIKNETQQMVVDKNGKVVR